MMPLYDFRCPQCGLEFEVSRPISRSSEPASCPQDGVEAERVFTMPMTFTRGSADSASLPVPPPSPGLGGHGHSHGPSGHSHGPGSHTH